MIKISKYLYIHWMFIVLFVFCYITRQLEVMCISYLIMSLHELSHLAAAKWLGLSCSYIVVYPFGLNLRLNNTMLYSICDEMILYFSGPLLNIVLALAALPFVTKNVFFYDFYIKNISLFIINMLPLIPLDGGMIIKKLFIYKFGFDKGCAGVKIISGIFLFFTLFFFGYLIYKNRFNPSFCIFAAFIIGNIFMSKEKYNSSLLKELLYCRRKKDKNKAYNAKIIGADESIKLIDIAKKFNMSSKYFVMITDKEDKVKKIKTEEEIINDILHKNI